jgi:hypothetical protein
VKQIFFIVSLSTICIGNSYSQSVVRDVHNSAGKVSQAGGITLTNNIGEPLTQNYFQVGMGRILTEGFIQPDSKDLSNASINEQNAGLDISIWPNPTTEGLTLSFGQPNNEIYTATVYDMNGKQIRLETICTGCNSHYMSFAELANASYVLRLSQAGMPVKEFKFIKMAP